MTAIEATAATIWLTADQQQVDTLALSLLNDPEVLAARAQGVSRLEKSLQFTVLDGPATLQKAVDNVLFGALQAAANNEPTHPRLVWSERLPYSFGEQSFPGCQYGGETPDRIYRGVGVSTDYRYEITGKRHPTHPSVDDFSVEAVPAPAMWGSPLQAVQAPEAIDVNQDGGFTIIADSTPTNGRRNHLYMPPGTKTLIVRDTLQDWASQVPNEVCVRVVDAQPAPLRSRRAIAEDATETFRHCVEMMVMFFDNALRDKPVNTLVPFHRDVQWGVPGGVFAFNRFELGDDEALLITLDSITARYLGIVVCDPWMLSSVAYDSRNSALNNVQAQPDDDGTYTFVLAANDPGVHNWLDTNGLRTGVVLARWERFDSHPITARDQDADDGALWTTDNRVAGAVRDIRVVGLSEVTSAVPLGQSLVDSTQRAEMAGRRRAEYSVRVTGRPIDHPSPRPLAQNPHRARPEP